MPMSEQEVERQAKRMLAAVFASELVALPEEKRDAHRVFLAEEGKALNVSPEDIKEILDLTEEIFAQLPGATS